MGKSLETKGSRDYWGKTGIGREAKQTYEATVLDSSKFPRRYRVQPDTRSAPNQSTCCPFTDLNNPAAT